MIEEIKGLEQDTHFGKGVVPLPTANNLRIIVNKINELVSEANSVEQPPVFSHEDLKGYHL